MTVIIGSSSGIKLLEINYVGWDAISTVAISI